MPTPELPPTYWDIVEILEARIRAAAAKAKTLAPDVAAELEYAPGSRIPTQEQLAEEFEVHRATVSRAIAMLKDRGLLVSRPPVGVYVARSI